MKKEKIKFVLLICAISFLLTLIVALIALMSRIGFNTIG